MIRVVQFQPGWGMPSTRGSEVLEGGGAVGVPNVGEEAVQKTGIRC
jgi:hypothetical protein